ncbi:hypothetical protein GH741_03555 [Aquibacillus halophilus]|uniref:DUF3221 domain-containing protein n=1 Tax=Aquibacillus halophilus TaxID=930132 RepID=A0A6A8D827_9BACI|nr:hypothetical protein [Aquibacillus halophilus]MRH41748.1 hypothetical protein [Aquibacillus halophilus]
MKKIMIPFLLLLIFLVGCSDFQGVILKVEKTSIVVGTDEIDPEAEYPSFKIMVDEETIISGEVESFSDLEKNQKVEIWILDKGFNNEVDHKIASKIVVGE